jgi:BASS family bile acid:Na+ symporter
MTATALLILGALPAIIATLPAIVSLLGNGTLAAMVLLAAVGLAAGHLLGGPDRDDRTVLALATSSRHPGVAIAIAATCFPDDEKGVVAAVLLYLIVNALLSTPYQIWARHQHAKLAHGI